MYDRYLRGQPLNDELAKVRDGSAQQAAVQAQQAARPEPVEDVERELERGERVALKEMVLSAGWPVLLRLLEKSFHKRRKGAISMSQDDPLGNERKVAEQWARTNAFEQAKREIPLLVLAEIEAMDGKQ